MTRIHFRIFTCVYVISLLGIFFCAETYGLDRDRDIHQFHHTAWTAKDGAPSQIVAFAQTQDGYLWIGSALGLFRFDGVTFERYEPPTGIKLPSYNIYALMATPDGGLWISFRPSGWGYLKDGELKLFTHPEEIPKSPIYCFARTPDGRIWAGTHDGLLLYNGSGWDEVGIDWGFEPTSVHKIFVGRDGTLWVAKEGAIVFLPARSKTFNSLEVVGKDGRVNQLAQAMDGRLWVAWNNDEVSPVDRPTPGVVTKKPRLNIGSSDLLIDRDGAMWIASGNTINRVRQPEKLDNVVIREDDDGPPLETFKESDGLSDPTAGIIFEDREGNIWVGTVAGLDRFRYSPIIPIAGPGVNKKMTLSFNDRSEIWASSAMVGSFLHLHDSKVDRVQLPPKMSQISSRYQDPDGSVWWGGYGGMWHQQDESFEFFPQPPDFAIDWIWEIFRGDNDGGLWVNFGDEGLIYFNNGVWQRRKPPDGLPGRGPSATFEDEQKRIWLGYTENRVCTLDSGRVRCYSGSDGIQIGRVKVIRGRDGNFWFGGEVGLAFFKDGKFYSVKTEGDAIGAVSGIIITENGDVWLNEIHGIINIPAGEVHLLYQDPDHVVRYRLYSFQDNLPGAPQMNFTVSTAVETPDRRLWFATDNGIALIDPASLRTNAVQPPVIVKSIYADENSYAIGSNTKIPAGTSDLQINYTATSLSIPERVKFKYRLRGYENDWRDAGTRREAYYTNLGPGNYHFQVIAANNDGIWNEDGAGLDFEILPRFYQTKLFLLICVGAFGIFGFVAYQWRIYHVKSRLQHQFDERLSERTRIAQDLHDTLLQGVVSAAMQLDVVTERVGESSPAKPMLDHINALMTNVLVEGRNALKGLRSPTVNYLSDLEQRLSDVRKELDIGEKVDFRTTVKGHPRPLLSAVGEETHQICREALTNAFRHSGGTLIEVEIEYAARQFRIIVRDNGRGIEPDTLRSGRDGHFGLSGMHERANSIGAELKVYSRSEGGTEVELAIPGRLAFETQLSNKAFRWLNFGTRRRPGVGRRTKL